MRNPSILPCIMIMIFNFTIFFIFPIFIFKPFFTNIIDFSFSYDSSCSFVNNFIFFFLKLNIFVACSIKDSQKPFHAVFTSVLYTSCLFSMLLNDDIVDIEKPEGICSPTFVLNEFFRIIFTSINLFY